MSSRASRTVYVGNLPGDVREREVEDLFYKYGPIVDIDLKLPPRPPGFCFVEFEDPRDAEDAIRGRDGYNFDGQRLRVELAHGGRLPSSNRYNNNNNNSTNNHGSQSGGRPGGVSRRTEYRVLVSGLPTSASWQDLKDHMRKAGDVCYAEVFRDGSGRVGVVDYTNYDDMKYAIKKLNESEFRNLFSRSYIRVKEDRGRSFRRSRSPSYSRSRSRSKGKSQSRSKSVSQSRSPSHSRSVSRSRSGSPRRRSYSRSISRSKSRSQSPVVAKRKRSLSRSPSRSHSLSRSGSTPRPEKKKSATAGAEGGPRSPSVSPRSKAEV